MLLANMNGESSHPLSGNWVSPVFGLSSFPTAPAQSVNVPLKKDPVRVDHRSPSTSGGSAISNTGARGAAAASDGVSRKPTKEGRSGSITAPTTSIPSPQIPASEPTTPSQFLTQTAPPPINTSSSREFLTPGTQVVLATLPAAAQQAAQVLIPTPMSKQTKVAIGAGVAAVGVLALILVLR